METSSSIGSQRTLAVNRYEACHSGCQRNGMEVDRVYLLFVKTRRGECGDVWPCEVDIRSLGEDNLMVRSDVAPPTRVSDEELLELCKDDEDLKKWKNAAMSYDNLRSIIDDISYAKYIFVYGDDTIDFTRLLTNRSNVINICSKRILDSEGIPYCCMDHDWMDARLKSTHSIIMKLKYLEGFYPRVFELLRAKKYIKCGKALQSGGIHRSPLTMGELEDVSEANNFCTLE